MLEEIVSSILGEQREPDQWEQTFLARALVAINYGCYALAKTYAGLAGTVAAERIPQTRLSIRVTWDDLTGFRVRLREAAAVPVLASPNFDFVEASDGSGDDVAETLDARSASAGD